MFKFIGTGNYSFNMFNNGLIFKQCIFCFSMFNKGITSMSKYLVHDSAKHEDRLLIPCWVMIL